MEYLKHGSCLLLLHFQPIHLRDYGVLYVLHQAPTPNTLRPLLYGRDKLLKSDPILSTNSNVKSIDSIRPPPVQPDKYTAMTYTDRQQRRENKWAEQSEKQVNANEI